MNEPGRVPDDDADGFHVPGIVEEKPVWARVNKILLIFHEYCISHTVWLILIMSYPICNFERRHIKKLIHVIDVLTVNILQIEKIEWIITSVENTPAKDPLAAQNVILPE